jgi:hypothetical protein
MVRRIRVCLMSGALLFCAIAPAVAFQPAGQNEFVPVTGAVPTSEQIPAAPLVIGAYAFFLLLMMFYLWTIWRRIGKVETDMRALERRQGMGPGSQLR